MLFIKAGVYQLQYFEGNWMYVLIVWGYDR
jgi:hypothetical protein